MLKRFVKDLLIYFPSKLLPALTAFITTPILTRLFLPAEYGDWALAVSISAFLVALVVSGFSSAVIRYYPAYKAQATLAVFFPTIIVSIGTVITIVAVGSFLTLFLLQGILPSTVSHFLPIVILIFVTESLFTVFVAVIRAQGRSGSFTTFQLLTKYGGLGIGLILVVFFGFRVDGLLWGAVLATVLTLPPLIFLATKGVGIRSQGFLLIDALQIGQYAWPLTLANIALWGLRVSDIFIIRLFRPERDVGLYSVAYNISAKSIELLVTMILITMGPMVMNTWEGEGQAATEKILTMVTRVYLILCVPAVVGLSVLAFPFLAFLTTPDYHEGYKIVGFVGLSSFAWGLAQISIIGAHIKKKTQQLAVNTIAASIVHIGLQFLLVPRFGYVASAVSTLVGYIVLLVLHILASRPHLNWRFPFGTLRNVGLASAAMGLVAWWVYGMSAGGNKGSLVYLFLSIVAAGLTYVICLWWIGEVKAEEKDTIQQMWFRIIGKETQADSGT